MKLTLKNVGAQSAGSGISATRVYDAFGEELAPRGLGRIRVAHQPKIARAVVGDEGLEPPTTSV